jgi:N6-L-threonylcarbamoyladenine synthase
MQKEDTKENKNQNNNVLILGIETSCDDTCASIVRDGNEILSNVVASQNEIHKKYGGVVPELASRRHSEVISIIINEALEQAGVELDEITAVSVTNRPGLIGSLIVGVGAAKAICYAKNLPLIAVNHLKAHLFSNMLYNTNGQDATKNDNPEGNPLNFSAKTGFIGLIVSGGHSSLYRVSTDWEIKEIGHTLDDAAGEAFDKIARYLGLGYPGGPIIDRMSKEGNPDFIEFPRPMIESGDFNFSFSGLKTSIIYKTKKNGNLMSEENLPDLVASFQKSIVDVLVEKTINACLQQGLKNILVSGGVAANSELRDEFRKKAFDKKLNVFIPPVQLCMDNAAMVACLGYYEYLKNNFAGLDIDVFSRSEI